MNRSVLLRVPSAPRALTTISLGAASAGFAGVVLVAEALWTVRRSLPSLQGLDASGIAVSPSCTGEPLRVVALGDSTLTGPGLDAGEQVWLRRALTGLRHGCPIELVSLALGGSRVVDVAALVDDAVDRRPHLVVVAVGANDALHGTKLRSFRTQFDMMLADVVARTPVVAVANIGDLGNIARVPAPLASVFRARARAFRSAIETIVARHDNVVLLDMTVADDRFRDRSVFGADLFHPNEFGHAAWADAALPGLRRAVQRAERARTRPGFAGDECMTPPSPGYRRRAGARTEPLPPVP